MGCNKDASAKKTANFAPAVYIFVTLFFLGFSGASQAQMMDLGDLQKWKYSGQSEDSHRGRACRFTPGPLKRDNLTRRFLQDYTFDFAARGADKAESLVVLQRANIRLISPATCAAATKTCEFEMPVEALAAAEGRATERYLIVLTSKENAPTEVLKAEMYFYGEGTGRKRLYLDCSRLSRDEAQR
jgi:hypothetical protein